MLRTVLISNDRRSHDEHRYVGHLRCEPQLRHGEFQCRRWLSGQRAQLFSALHVAQPENDHQEVILQSSIEQKLEVSRMPNPMREAPVQRTVHPSGGTNSIGLVSIDPWRWKSATFPPIRTVQCSIDAIVGKRNETDTWERNAS